MTSSLSNEIILNTEIIGKGGIKLITRLVEKSDTDKIVEIVNWAYRGKESTKPWTTEEGLVTGFRVTPEMLHSDLEKDQNITKVMLIEQIIEPSISPDQASIGNGADQDTASSTPTKLVIGCVKIERESLDSKEAVIGMLSVDPSLQSMGIGNILVKLAEREIKLWNVQESHLHVVNIRDTLIAWYNKLGYITTNTTFPFDVKDAVALKEMHFVLLVKNLLSSK